MSHISAAERRAYDKAYNQRPEVKERRAAYSREYYHRPGIKEKIQARAKRPEVKEKRRIATGIYRRRPEIIESLRLYRQQPKVREQLRKHLLETRYGISLGDFDSLLMRQGGSCAICKTRAWGPKGPSVDHDHGPSAGIRGVLCIKCNMAIGLIGDNPQRARAIARYLEKYKKREKKS